MQLIQEFVELNRSLILRGLYITLYSSAIILAVHRVIYSRAGLPEISNETRYNEDDTPNE